MRTILTYDGFEISVGEVANNEYTTDIKQNYFITVLELQNHFLKKLRVIL